ncbi:hypothetical protein EON83_29545 [bacterium]|nr:MAG: hypothetical protein EON83_29545 [bacterium]
MEFENLSEHAKHEARRVAAAFELETWSQTPPYPADLYVEFEGYVGGILVDWDVDNTGQIGAVGVKSKDNDWIQVINYAEYGWRFDEEWRGQANPILKNFFACGLYRLGIERENLFTFLGQSFTAHEKLELRVSMPREFWLKEWFDGGEA